MRLEVGAELPELRGPVLDRTRLATFAGGSGDLNPIHLDGDLARAAGYPDVFAHGMLSMALLGRALSGWIGQDRVRRFRARFTALTPVNAHPVCTGKVVALEDHDGEPCARLDLTVRLDDGTVTVTGEALVALATFDLRHAPPRGPSSAGGGCPPG